MKTLAITGIRNLFNEKDRKTSLLKMSKIYENNNSKSPDLVIGFECKIYLSPTTGLGIKKM